MLKPVLAAALALVGAGDAEKVAQFGNWAGACDNANRCEAVSLQPLAWNSADPVPFTIAREAGPAGAMTIEVVPHATPGRVMFAIDGRQVAPGLMLESGIKLAGSDAEGLARGMVKGKILTVRDYRGRVVARVSLNGAVAMLRWIDTRQGRSGGITALVARGPAPAVRVPAAVALPTVTALRPLKGEAKVAPALLAQMIAAGRCESDNEPDAEIKPVFARLDAKAVLAIIPCGSGAYNSNEVPFVVRGDRFEPAKFDRTPDGETGPDPVVLSNTKWDAKGVLSHKDLARGIGDCGSTQQWVWDGQRFRTILRTALEECRGATEWPVLYRANVVWK